ACSKDSQIGIFQAQFHLPFSTKLPIQMAPTYNQSIHVSCFSISFTRDKIMVMTKRKTMKEVRSWNNKGLNESRFQAMQEVIYMGPVEPLDLVVYNYSPRHLRPMKYIPIFSIIGHDLL
ncbi:Hypothetical predicted protein, partial [Olea europaea subsp. europaea]